MKRNDDSFEALIAEVGEQSKTLHRKRLISHAQANASSIEKSIRDLPPAIVGKSRSTMLLSAGPSIHRQKSIERILQSRFNGTTIAVDGCYISCLKKGLIPDFVVTLDPHETRVVRWFGDPEFEEHNKHDDYFQRQDLDVSFRNNLIEQNNANIELVNKFGHKTKAIVSTSAPANVVQRLKDARFDMYWWNPLVDDPQDPESITRQLFGINRIPCMNTGGNVGAAAWVFASTYLKADRIGLAGMDFGYYGDLPYSMTQKYYELIHHLGTDDIDLDPYFPRFTFPLTGEAFYTDATYYWYRKNFLELMAGAKSKTFNCTEGGILFSKDLPCIRLDQFLNPEELSHGESPLH